MREDIVSHIGLPKDAPERIHCSDGSFIEPVPAEEKRDLRRFMKFISLLVIVLFGVLFISLAVAIWQVIIGENWIVWTVIVLVLLVFLCLLSFFFGHFLKLKFINMVSSRPNRLFEPDWSCVYSPMEDLSTSKKIKLAADDHALINFSDGWVEIEMTRFRARLRASELSMKNRIIGFMGTVCLELSSNFGVLPWRVILWPFAQDSYLASPAGFRARRWLRWRIEQGVRRGNNKAPALMGLLSFCAFVGVAHFFVSFIVWIGFFAFSLVPYLDMDWFMLIHAVPALVLLALFGYARWQLFKRMRRAVICFCIAIVMAVGCFLIDTKAGFYQLPIPIGKKVYSTWWWFNVPWKIFIYEDSYYQTLRYGYIDKQGNMAIGPQFKKARSFSEGLAAVKIDDKWGYISQSGNLVIGPRFEWAHSFSEGLAKVAIDRNYGFIDKTGEIVIALEYGNASDFSEGLAWVRKGSCPDCIVGYINKTGEYVIDLKFDYAYDFSEGLAAVEVDELYGYIDINGDFVIEPQFGYARPFSEGFARVRVGDSNDSLDRFINKKGQFIADFNFDYARSFSEGLAAVEIDNKWGFINTNGDIIIEPQFLDVDDFHEGLAFVENGNNGKLGYRRQYFSGFINKEGEYVFKVSLQHAAPFKEGMNNFMNDDYLYGYMDTSGKVVIEPKYFMAGPFYEGLALVRVDPEKYYKQQ